MFHNVSDAVQAVISQAAQEAARRGDRRIGTDHLLLGLLHRPDIAEQLGTDPERARAVADGLDRAALAAIGIDLGAVRLPAAPPAAGKATPSSGMRTALARAFELARQDRVRAVAPTHLLRALQELEQPDPAATLLRALGD